MLPACLTIDSCPQLPGQQGVYAAHDLPVNTVFAGRSLPVRFNERRWRAGVQIKLNSITSFDLTMSDKWMYKLNCAGDAFTPFSNCQFIQKNDKLALIIPSRIQAGEQLLVPWYF